MSSYNKLTTLMRCPRCGQETEMVIDCYFGYTVGFAWLHLGDVYPWSIGKAVRNGGRPEKGNLDGEGYSECPLCGKDFFVQVIVRSDVLQSAEVDAIRMPYILN